MNKKRIRKLNKKEIGKGDIVYWMNRDQRVEDNWALIAAQKTAIENDVSLKIVFNLVNDFPSGNLRHYTFMIEGLREVEVNASKYNIEFILLTGDLVENISNFVEKNSVGAIFTDFSPMRIARKWREDLVEKVDIAFYEVDTHNIIPVWVTSDKQEYAARTIRSKIHRNLDEFLTDIPKIEKMNNDKIENNTDWEKIYGNLDVDKTVKPIDWLKPGSKEGVKVFEQFVEEKLEDYDEKRNDPNEDVLSNLSVYYHYGQIAPQRVAWELKQMQDREHGNSKISNAIDAYLEEMIVRRELSDNFCFYNKNYDNFDGFSDWAKKTLKDHWDDPRDFTYTQEQFENAETHEDLWNAAQNQLLKTGKIHGYMRMYWAKKILEWSEDPKEAIKIAIYLNDKYSIDGRDPNGYVGVMWSIGGIHDRGWFEREVYGKIRYMNRNGAKRKFDVDEYVDSMMEH